MKRKIWLLLILVLVLLTGCRKDAPPALQETQPVSETQAVLPEPTGEETQPVETEPPETEPQPFVVEVQPVITGNQNSVTVTDINEFLAALAPDTQIIVDTALMDLSRAKGYASASGEYYYWAETFDGPELVICGLSNLTIRGKGDDHNANVISSVPRYSCVLTFENCANVHFVGLTVGHTEEPGYCSGGVLRFRNSQDVLVEDCGLFGCGTIGVIGESSARMQIINNDIYECTVAGAEFSNCDDVNVDGCTIRDIGTEEYPGRDFRVYGCGSITCNGEPVHDFSPRQ